MSPRDFAADLRAERRVTQAAIRRALEAETRAQRAEALARGLAAELQARQLAMRVVDNARALA